MIIRNLRPDEYQKSAKVISAAYTFKWTEQDEAKIFNPEYCYGAFEGDTLMSLIYSVPLEARYFGNYIPCAGAGMIATLPEYRRKGCVRALFRRVFEDMKKRGEVFSYLYPFSYDYYRKFGYEQFAAKYVLTFPIQSLPAHDFGRGRILDSIKDFEKAVAIYDCYTKGVEAAFRRSDAMWDKKLTLDPYSGGLHTYIWSNDQGEDKAFATLKLENGLLEVTDMAYCDFEGLKGILGFLRRFAGRALEVRFDNVSQDSPLQYVISEYSNSKGSLSSWAMARTLDVQSALERAKYPLCSGRFSLKVEDSLEWNNKIFRVEYSNGRCEVTAADDGQYDLKLGIPLLTRILLGSDTFTPRLLSYCDCELKGDITGLLAVFHRRERYLNDSAI